MSQTDTSDPIVLAFKALSDATVQSDRELLTLISTLTDRLLVLEECVAQLIRESGPRLVVKPNGFAEAVNAEWKASRQAIVVDKR
jgi:hypothetical protein